MNIDSLWLVIGLVIAFLVPFSSSLTGKYLNPKRGGGVREDSLEHAVMPEFSPEISEAVKNSVLHGLAYPHGGVMNKTTRKLIAQRKISTFN